MLRECNTTAVQLHAFSGRASQGLEAAQRGWMLSVPPCVVRSEQVRTISQIHGCNGLGAYKIAKY